MKYGLAGGPARYDLLLHHLFPLIQCKDNENAHQLQCGSWGYQSLFANVPLLRPPYSSFITLYTRSISPGFGWALSLKCFLSLHDRTHPFPSKSRTTRTYDYRLSASLFPSHIRPTTLMIPKRRCNLSNFLCWESVLFVFFCAQHLLGHFCHLFLQIDNAWQLFFRCKRKLNF